MEQGGDLQQQPVARPEAVLVLERVEDLHRERRDVAAVLRIEPVFVPERLGAGQDLLLEVRRARRSARVGEVEQEAGAQRRVRNDEPAGGRLGHQRTVDEQGWHERLRFDRRQAKALDQLLFVEALDLIAEGEERVARNLTDAVVGVGLEDLRRREAHVAVDRHDVGDAAQRVVDPDLLDHVRDRPF